MRAAAGQRLRPELRWRPLVSAAGEAEWPAPHKRVSVSCRRGRDLARWRAQQDEQQAAHARQIINKLRRAEVEIANGNRSRGNGTSKGDVIRDLWRCSKLRPLLVGLCKSYYYREMPSYWDSFRALFLPKRSCRWATETFPV